MLEKEPPPESITVNNVQCERGAGTISHMVKLGQKSCTFYHFTRDHLQTIIDHFYPAPEQPAGEGEVTLRLSREEATTLSEVLWHVGGSPRGARGHCDSIRRSLESTGIRRSSIRYNSGVITLRDRLI